MITTFKSTNLYQCWTIFDSLQFFRIKMKISYYQKRKIKKIKTGFLRPSVEAKLNALGYDIYFYDFGENSWNEIIINS